MVNTSNAQTVSLDSLLDPADMADVEMSFGGPVGNIHIKDGLSRARPLVQKINARLARGTAYLRSELPERFHYHTNARGGDIVIVMDESWSLTVPRPSRAGTSAPERAPDDRRGNHRWDNMIPSMRAVFLLMGPGIREGALIRDVQNVDVYPLMTELLGLQPAADIDGRQGAIAAQVRK